MRVVLVFFGRSFNAVNALIEGPRNSSAKTRAAHHARVSASENERVPIGESGRAIALGGQPQSRGGPARPVDRP
jgi:hypothetical protein